MITIVQVTFINKHLQKIYLINLILTESKGKFRSLSIKLTQLGRDTHKGGSRYQFSGLK